MKTDCPISDIKVRCFEVPVESPESDGTLKWNKTIMVYVEVMAEGYTGMGYSYADKSTAVFIDEHLKDVVIGRNALHTSALWKEMYVRIRNLGNPGISSMAISAVDIALWDLKSKILQLPVIDLLGKVRDKIPAYGSGGFTSYSSEELKNQFENWLKEGFFMFKMKVGRNPEEDLQRIRQAREIIGEDNHLFVDANGAFNVRQAVEMGKQYDAYNVTWYEEPVSSDDMEGLHFVREHVPPAINVTAGEYGYTLWYFQKMLQQKAVDVLQVDATRCGGYTGFLKAAVLCEAYQLPLSAHTAPALHAGICCSADKAIHVEYFFDHARIEKMFFEGFPSPELGNLKPPSGAGLGLHLKEKETEKYRIS